MGAKDVVNYSQDSRNRALKPLSDVAVTAYHEAGHAIVLLLFGTRFGDLTIVPNKQNLGEVRPTPNVTPADVDRMDELKANNEIPAFVLVPLAAGAAAVSARFDHETAKKTWIADYLAAKEKLPHVSDESLNSWLGVTPDDISSFSRNYSCNYELSRMHLAWRGAFRYALELLTMSPAHWTVVNHLALELLEHRTVSYQRCKEIFDEHVNRSGGVDSSQGAAD